MVWRGYRGGRGGVCDVERGWEQGKGGREEKGGGLWIIDWIPSGIEKDNI